MKEVVVEVKLPEPIYLLLRKWVSHEELSEGIRTVFLSWLGREMEHIFLEIIANSDNDD